MPDLEDLYREIILDHYRNPRNKGELSTPPATRTEGMNPLCGDEIVVYLDIDASAGTGDAAVVRDIKIGGQGCSISQSSASMMSSAVKGRTVAEARRVIRAFKSMMSIHEAGGEPDPVDGHVHDGDAHEHEHTDHTHDEEPVKLGDLAALKGVVKFPVRIKCATLSWNTMAQGLDDATSSAP
jgi:nitrogen fixation protein NifU and related proteins